jgi:hypothetical protein
LFPWQFWHLTFQWSRGSTITNTSNDNILLVTHQVVCKVILKIVKNYGVLKPNKEDLLSYPKGGLTEVFDNTYWVFKPINWKST